MNARRRLDALARRLDELDAQQEADGFAPIPYRLYELDDASRRVYVEPDEGERELDERARRLVHGR